MSLRERLGRDLLIFDGGFGTMIQPYMVLGELPEMLNLRVPDKVTEVHRAYLNAGADIIETNSLNANRRKVEKAGSTVEKVITAAVQNARNAVDNCGREAYVALSMGSTGVMLEPLGDMSFDEAVDIYAEMAAAGANAGADMILIETVSDLHEIKAAITGAHRVTDLPIAVSLTFMENGRLLTGADMMTAVNTIEALGVDVIGLNCGLGPKQMLDLTRQMSKYAGTPIMVNPNAGLPRLENGVSVYSLDPAAFTEDAVKLPSLGASMVGGCCGTTPAHISMLKKALEGVSAIAVTPKDDSVITSGSKSAVLADSIEIEDISGDDMDDMLDTAMESEAAAIKICCDELPEAVKYIQEMFLKPMYIVSGDSDEIEKALRYYNGKPLIGIADENNIDEYIRIAKSGGAALTVSDPSLCDKAAQVLGAKNVFIDRGDLLEKADGTAKAQIIQAE